jgi:predicted phage terminase large subunit-like protein
VNDEELDQRTAAAPLLSPAALATTLTKLDTTPWFAYQHHRLISRKLVQLHARFPGARRNLMVMAPPRHGKSELCSHWFPTWCYALNPKTKIIMCSYAQTLASRFSRATRQTLQSHYPLVGTRLVEDSRAAHRWETTEGGEMFAAGIGTGISGRGADVLILDDPVADAESANSEKVRQNTWDWYETTFLSRRAPDAIQILIMTRWHEDDLAGRLLKNEPDNWEVLRLPALAEEGDDDPLGRREGEALWAYDRDGKPRYPVSYLQDVKRRGSRTFNALFQQRPAGVEGLGVERLWWRRYSEEPAEIAGRCDKVIQSWDTTFKDTDSSDYVAGMVLGRMGERVYLLDAIQKHLNAPNTMREIRAFRRKWPMAKPILIEESANGPAIIQMLDSEIPGILPVRAKGSKTVRLHWGVSSVAGFIEDGHVYLPSKHTAHGDRGDCHVEVAEELVNEGANFPHGAHDDLLDACVQGVSFLIPATWAALRKWGNEIQEEVEEGGSFVEQHVRAVKQAIKRKIEALQKNQDVGSDMPGW